jgi:hypothetical protein
MASCAQEWEVSKMADWEPEELLLNKAARRSEQFVSISVADLFVGRRSAGRPGLDFASVGQASDSGSWRTNRPVDSADHTCWDHSVCHHVSLMVGNI